MIALSAIRKLSSKDMQEIIGDRVLERLEKLLPYIGEKTLADPEEIYSKKNLSRIVDAISGIDLLSKKSARKRILGALSEKELDKLSKKMNLSVKGDFIKKLERISKFRWGNNSETEAFLDYFNIRNSKSREEIRKNIEEIDISKYPYKNLRDYQHQIYLDTLKYFESPAARAIIWMPTGSGKTLTAMAVICDYLNNYPNKSIIWLASSEELCEQAAQSFIQTWEHVGRHKIDLIRAWGNYKIKIPKKPSFIIGGFSKIYSQSKKDKEVLNKISESLSLIIVDEAHQSIATTYKKVVLGLLGKNYSIRLAGLTATPSRTKDKETEELKSLYFDDIISIDSGEKDVFEYLKDKGILSEAKRDILMTDAIFNLTDKEKKYVEENLDFPDGFLKRVSEDVLRNVEIIKKLKREFEEGKKILFFGTNLEQSKFICTILNFIGIKAEHLDWNTSNERRLDIVKQFKEGKLNILCNYGILTTGFDVPDIDTIFIARPTLSINLYSQMIGRGLRGPLNGGTKYCKIIDVVDNITNYSSPSQVFDSFEDYWEKQND